MEWWRVGGGGGCGEEEEEGDDRWSAPCWTEKGRQLSEQMKIL